VRDERSECYELLGVAPGASAEELKAAHRDLVKVWHPDRFSHDPRLQQKAQEKLKAINEAYDLLISGRPGRRAPAPAERPHAPAPHARRARWPLICAAALVCGVVFYFAGRTLIPRGGPRPQSPASAAGRPAPAEKGPRPEAEAPASNQRARDKKTSERPDAAEAPPSGDSAHARGAAEVRALPTVTLLIDPTTGLLATPACPARSRTSYASGNEPRRYCDAHTKTKARGEAAPQSPAESRL